MTPSPSLMTCQPHRLATCYSLDKDPYREDGSSEGWWAAAGIIDRDPTRCSSSEPQTLLLHADVAALADDDVVKYVDVQEHACSHQCFPESTWEDVSKRFLVGDADGGMELHEFPLTLFPMKNSAPPGRHLRAVWQGDYWAGNAPADIAFRKGLCIWNDDLDLAPNSLRFLFQERVGLFPVEPFFGVSPDYAHASLTGDVSVTPGNVPYCGCFKPTDDDFPQFR